MSYVSALSVITTNIHKAGGTACRTSDLYHFLLPRGIYEGCTGEIWKDYSVWGFLNGTARGLPIAKSNDH